MGHSDMPVQGTLGVSQLGYPPAMAIPPGSATACGLQVHGDPDTGIYSDASNTLRMAFGGSAPNLHRAPDLLMGQTIKMNGKAIQFVEMSTPGDPGANNCFLYVADNAGKTTLYANFNGGVPQSIVAEP